MMKNLSTLLVLVIAFKAEPSTGNPFFGVPVQAPTGVFRAELDIYDATVAVSAAFDSLNTCINTIVNPYPYSDLILNNVANATLKMYDGIGIRVKSYIQLLSNAAIDKTTQPSVLCTSLATAAQSVISTLTALESSINVIASYSGTLGANFRTVNLRVSEIITDLQAIVDEFLVATGALAAAGQPITPTAVFAKLDKFRLTIIVGALGALKSQITIFNGLVEQVGLYLTNTETLLISYENSVENGVRNNYNTLSSIYSGASTYMNNFLTSIRAWHAAINTEMLTFNARINAFTDNIVGANKTSIITATNNAISVYNRMLTIINPNINDLFAEVLTKNFDLASSTVENVLFNLANLLNRAILQFTTTTPANGKLCAERFLTPYVQTLGNALPTVGNCLSASYQSPGTIFDEQNRIFTLLYNDRMYYINLWKETIQGLTDTSPAVARNMAVNLLRASLVGQYGSISILTSGFSSYAQFVSNFESRFNRVQLCVTQVSNTLTLQQVVMANNFYTCLQAEVQR